MENLSISTKDAGEIMVALGISESRADEIYQAFESEFDKAMSPENGKESIRMTDLAKIIIDTVKPNANELFFIGVKMGEIVERQHIARSMMPDPEEMLSALLNSVPKGEA